MKLKKKPFRVKFLVWFSRILRLLIGKPPLKCKYCTRRGELGEIIFCVLCYEPFCKKHGFFDVEICLLCRMRIPWGDYIIV